MRFRPLTAVAATLVGALLLLLSLFHYYTAGFGLLQEITHRGVHLAFVLGLIFLVFPHRKALLEQPAAHRLLAPGSVPWFDWLLAAAMAVSVLYIPWIFDDLAFRVGNPGTLDVAMGSILDRGPAGGHPAQHGLAAAVDRHRLHGLRAGRAGVPGAAEARRRQLEPAGQPPVPHQPGHLRRGGRRGGDLRLPLRAVRRAGHAHRPGAAVPGRGLVHRRALRRRAGQGQRVRLGDVRHAVGQLGGQCGDGGLADHPGDDPRGLQARVRRRGGSRQLHRRADHAAGAGRGGLPDDRVPVGAVPDDHHRGRRCRPSCTSSACSCRCTSRPSASACAG